MGYSPQAEDSFDWTSVAPSDAHYALALEAFNTGCDFQDIVIRLTERGLSAELIPDVTTAVALNHAAFWLAARKSQTELTELLTERGLSAHDAATIVKAAERRRDHAHTAMGMGKWQTRSLITGGVVLSTGVALHVVNRLFGPVVPQELVVALIGLGVLLAAGGGLSLVFV